MRIVTACLLLAGLFSVQAGAQPVPDDWPVAATADVSSIDAVMTAVYDVISGPKGQVRDLDRFKSLFYPNAKLIPVGQNQEGTVYPTYMALDGYLERAAPFFEANGFFEVEIARKTEQYGSMAHAFSTYESRRNADDEVPFARGINSFQLQFDGTRWWVVNIFWLGERPEMPIPEAYLPGN